MLKCFKVLDSREDVTSDGANIHIADYASTIVGESR